MLNSLNKKIYILVSLNFMILLCFAQVQVDNDVNNPEITQPKGLIGTDHLEVQLPLVDSLAVDSLNTNKLYADTLKTSDLIVVKDVEQIALYDSLFYSADSIHYEFANEKIDFTGSTKLEFEGATLSADTLSLDMKEDKAIAKGKSYMEQGDHQMIGRNIYYDLETRWGRIIGGASQFDLGYYYGEEIRKVDEKTYDMDNGYYTTCDAEEPHFYIGAKQFRMYQNDKIVAKPIVFYANHVPIFALPFGTFSIKKGRKSGILTPSPGYDSGNGKKIEDIAFYFAHRDHFDATLFMSIYEKTGWKFGLKSEYITRYKMNGNFSAILDKSINSPISANLEWRVKGRHHQDFGNKTTLDADFNFYSNKSIWEDSSDLDERLSESITSTIVYKKPIFSSNLILKSTYTDDLKNKRKSITLPSISYSQSSKPIHELFAGDSFEKNRASNSWFNDIYFKYGVKALHSGTINDSSATFWDVIYKTKEDSTGYINQHNAGVNHDFTLSFRPEFKGWLNFSHAFNYTEAWFDRDIDNNKFVRGYDYSFSSSAKFSLYGLREFKGNYLKAIRHVITPNVSFSYKPDFTKNDSFYSFSGIGVNKSDRSKRLNFSIKNGWDLKVSGKDEAPDKRINDLFTVSSSLSYNFEAENERFSDILHTLNVKSGSVKFWLLDLSIFPSGSITQDFYRFKENTLDYSNWSLAISDWKLKTSSTLKFAGEASYVDYFPVIKNDFVESDFFANDSLEAQEEESVATLEEYERLEREDKKWSFSFTHSFGTDKDNYGDHEFTSTLVNKMNLRISKNWYATYGNTMNLKDKEVTIQSISLVRNLHCWSIKFEYSRSINYWSYKLNFFNIELPNDLKFKTSDQGN